MNMPPGATTRTSKGRGGSGVHEKRPSASVVTVPGRPRIVTSAPATGVPSGCTTRPVNATAGDIRKSGRRTARQARPTDIFTRPA